MERAIVALGVVLLAALAIATSPDARDEIHWRWVSHQDSVAGYRSYVTASPPGRYASAAKAQLDEHAWSAANRINTVSALQDYLVRYPGGKHTSAAQTRLDAHAWAEAARANTVKSYQAYLSAYPKGTFAQQALGNAGALRSDEALYEAALAKGTEAAVVAFLADHPGHIKEEAAREALREVREGRDIVDLLEEGKIEVKALGNGISRVQVQLRRLVPSPLTVRIPVGSFFVSANTSAQNMVTTSEKKVRLISADWQSVSADAACANRPKRVPGGGDTFAVQRSPHQAELARLMPVLDKARVDFKTRQAAVWIVTDNATYGDLGLLITSRAGFGGTRTIREKDAAHALRICHEVGIDLTEKAIRHDYRQIASALEAGELKSWLEQITLVAEQKERDRLIAGYTKAIEANPKNAAAYNDRGVTYDKNGQFDLAVADLTKAIEIDPRNVKTLTNRGFVYQTGKKDLDQAIQDYDRSIATNPSYLRAYAGRAMAFEAKGDKDRAIADYRRALSVGVEMAWVDIRSKAENDREIARYTKSIEGTNSIERMPEQANLYVGRGHIYLTKGELDRAVADYTKAIEIEPRNTQALANRGAALEKMGELDRAIADYTALVAIHPKDASALLNRGNAYQAKKAFDQAIADYDSVIAVDQSFTGAYIGRGTAHEAKGDKDRAIADYRHALKMP